MPLIPEHETRPPKPSLQNHRKAIEALQRVGVALPQRGAA